MKNFIILTMVLIMVAPAMAFHSRAGRDYDCSSCHIPHTKAQVAWERDGNGDYIRDGNGDRTPIYGAGGMEGVPPWSGLAVTDPGNWEKYASPTLNASVGNPKASTLLCLACHDASDGTSHALSDTAGDLSTTHPIEFSYDSALVTADGELHPVSALSGIAGGGTIDSDLLFDYTGAENTMNCVSCHEIHINGLSDTVVPYDDGDPCTIDTSHTFRMAYLQPIAGIEFKVHYGGDETVEDDYELNYGALCRTCHIK